jgi:DNA-binding response OmpR family regulator
VSGVAAPLFLAGDEQDSAEPDPARARHLRPVGDDPRGARKSALSVLLVEDDPAMRLLCRFNLEAAGFRVVEATTGLEALELASGDTFDVALLDVMLPDLGGFDVAARLGGVPIVFISARTAENDLEQGRRAGAIDYVTKPFDPVALPARLQEDLEELGRGDADSVWALRHGRRFGQDE